MHHPVLVRVGQRARDLAENPHALAHRKLAPPREPDPERLPLHERHREVRDRVHLAGREQRHDVRVLEPGRNRDLAPEPLGRDAGRHLGRQDLHDDGAPERRFFRGEDARHSPAAELAVEGI